MLKAPHKVTSVLATIDKYLYTKSAAPLPYTPKPSFSPSMLGTKCIRKLYYAYSKAEKDQPFQSFLLRIFKTGDAFHKMVQGWLMETGQLIPYLNKDGSIPKSRWNPGEDDIEFPVKDAELEISGKIDGVGIIDGKLWLYEIKSINADKFKELKAPLADHIEQSMTYVYTFENNLNEGKYSHIPQLEGWDKVEGIIFIYVNKNTTFMKEFRVQADLATFEGVIRKMVEVKQHIAADTLPKLTQDRCDQCNFKNKCDANQKITK